jgi:hypothetical protein
MGTGLMQWTAAEMVECDCNRLLRLCNFFFGLCFHDGCKLTNPSALILSVKFCDQETGTNLHTQERNKRFSTLQLLAISPSCSVWRHFFVMFCLAPYLSLPKLVLVRLYTFFVMMFGDPSTDPTDPKKHGLTHPQRPPS